MAFMKFEIYGRFIVAEERSQGDDLTGKVTFIAPRLTKGGFATHRPVLCIPRKAVELHDETGNKLTTAAPTARVMKVTENRRRRRRWMACLVSRMATKRCSCGT